MEKATIIAYKTANASFFSEFSYFCTAYRVDAPCERSTVTNQEAV